MVRYLFGFLGAVALAILLYLVWGGSLPGNSSKSQVPPLPERIDTGDLSPVNAASNFVDLRFDRLEESAKMFERYAQLVRARRNNGAATVAALLPYGRALHTEEIKPTTEIVKSYPENALMTGDEYFFIQQKAKLRTDHFNEVLGSILMQLDRLEERDDVSALDLLRIFLQAHLVEHYLKALTTTRLQRFLVELRQDFLNKGLGDLWAILAAGDGDALRALRGSDAADVLAYEVGTWAGNVAIGVLYPDNPGNLTAAILASTVITQELVMRPQGLEMPQLRHTGINVMLGHQTLNEVRKRVRTALAAIDE